MICQECGKKVYFGLFEPAKIEDVREKHKEGAYIISECIVDNFCPDCKGDLHPENEHDKELLGISLDD